MNDKNLLIATAEDVIRDNMMDYAGYVILQRALPDVRDGQKPVQRRILYTMHVEGATNLMKSADIEGSVMKYHPHGSSYGVMVNMAQKDKQTVPLLIGKGNFGQYTSSSLKPASSRYTEVKLSPLAIETLEQLKDKSVTFIPNYNGEKMMPEVLPVTFPWVLAHASSGVGYGMASSIPSFNIKELCEAITDYLKTGTKKILVPDFGTGAQIAYDPEALKKINLHGNGTITLRSPIEVDGYNVSFTEVPYGVTRESIIEKIVSLSKTKLKEVAEVKDLTGLKGMKVRIRFKRGTDMNLAIVKLFQYTPLQSTFSANMNVITSNGMPKVLGVWSMIDEWLKWRKTVIVRGSINKKLKLEKELNFLEGLQLILINLDKAIEIIRFSKNDDIEPKLMEEFNVNREQAESIANMKLRNINKDYIINSGKKIEAVKQNIQALADLIESDELQSEFIINDMDSAAKKYGVERRTKLVQVNTEKIKEAKKKLEEVPDYPVKILVTKEGYVKKIGINAEVTAQYLKPGDQVVQIFKTRNKAEVLVFDKDKCCYKIKISDLEESTPKALGTFIPSVTDAKDIVGYSILDGEAKFIIIGYDNNKIAKIKLDSYEGNRKKLANSLAKNAEVVSILTFYEEGDFAFKTDKSGFKVNTSMFELKERWTQGVYGPRKGQLTKLIKL